MQRPKHSHLNALLDKLPKGDTLLVNSTSICEDEKAIFDADDLRLRATERRDADTLASLLLDDFSYVHMIGYRETGQSYVQRLRTDTTTRYLAVERRSARVRIYGDVAVMEGEANLRYESPIGSPARDAPSLYLAVWIRSGGMWRLASYASTALPVAK